MHSVATINIGDAFTVNRLGFGAMRLCGPRIWGWPADRENALRVLRRAVELDGFEEGRHKEVLSNLVEAYGIRLAPEA